MTKLLTVKDILNLIRHKGIVTCLSEVTDQLAEDFTQWSSFEKRSRVATHLPDGVIELMPTCAGDYYAYKYVNGHPKNPQQGKLTVAALGMLSDVTNGYPVLISEMTVLTAIRTAATSALAARYLAPKHASAALIIGTGSQAEFQTLALHDVTPFETIYYFDTDPKAMAKFAHNLKRFKINLQPIQKIEDVIDQVAVVTTATAAKAHVHVLKNDWLKSGIHINGVGGDCPGKTELDPKILERAKVIVEYLPQSKIEGEIQHLDNGIHAELWQLVCGQKIGRENQDEITVFDSVGFAIEDYSVLKYFYQLAQQYNIGQNAELTPHLEDPKDLFALLD